MKMLKNNDVYIYLPKLLSKEFVEFLYRVDKEKEKTVVLSILAYGKGRYQFFGNWTETNKEDFFEHYMKYDKAVELYPEYFV